jgi:signal transduction histidine kinase
MDARTRVKVGRVQMPRSLLSRIRALPPGRADALLAAALLAEGVFEALVFAPITGGTLALVLAVMTAQAAALAVRRRWPLVMLLVVFGLEPILEACGRPVTDHMAGPLFWLLLAGYSWGMHTEGARAWWGAGYAAVTVTLGQWVDAYDDDVTAYLSSISLVGVAPIIFGQVLRNRTRLNRALHQRAERAEREREAAAESAALEERTRIAGDLHDVVAHALSAMTVQAAAARRMAERDPTQAEASFAVVEHTGREALTELRRLLGVLRREDEELALAPQPSLVHVRSLIQRATASGLRVQLRIDGEPLALPAGVDLTAYRLVQEALRRAQEGGGAGRASVRVTYAADEVRVEVLDDGAAENRRLLGLRERVAVYGGELKASAADGGGWRVAARLPVGTGA